LLFVYSYSTQYVLISARRSARFCASLCSPPFRVCLTLAPSTTTKASSVLLSLYLFSNMFQLSSKRYFFQLELFLHSQVQWRCQDLTNISRCHEQPRLEDANRCLQKGYEGSRGPQPPFYLISTHSQDVSEPHWGMALSIFQHRLGVSFHFSFAGQHHHVLEYSLGNAIVLNSLTV
jgi:hypothetical protein